MYRDHVTWLYKKRAKAQRMCNQLFILSWESRQRSDDHVLYGKNKIEIKWV